MTPTRFHRARRALLAASAVAMGLLGLASLPAPALAQASVTPQNAGKLTLEALTAPPRRFVPRPVAAPVRQAAMTRRYEAPARGKQVLSIRHATARTESRGAVHAAPREPVREVSSRTATHTLPAHPTAHAAPAKRHR